MAKFLFVLSTVVADLDGRHLINWILDWPNPRGFTKGVRFVYLNRYVQVDRKPFGQSEIRWIRVLRSFVTNKRFRIFLTMKYSHIVYLKWNSVRFLISFVQPYLQYLFADMKDCNLRPYVSYRTKDIYQEPLTSKDLFNAIYGHKILTDFKEGKIDESGKSKEPSKEEKLTPDEAWWEHSKIYCFEITHSEK